MLTDFLIAQVGHFTVDVSAKEVAIANDTNLIERQSSYYYFAPKDNVTLISYGIMFPHSFAGGSVPVTIHITAKDGAGLPIAYSQVSDLRPVTENTEIPADIFLPWPGALIKCGIQCGIISAHTIGFGTVSMLNVPAVLDTDIFPVYMTAHVRHTLPMVV